MAGEDSSSHVAAEKRVLRQSEQVAFPTHRNGSPGGFGIIVDKRDSVAERNIPIAVNHTAISNSLSGVSKIIDETGIGSYGYCPCFCCILQSILPNRHRAPKSISVGTESKVTGKNGIRSYSYCTCKNAIIKYTTQRPLHVGNIIPVEYRMISYDNMSPVTHNRTSLMHPVAIISPEQSVVSYHQVCSVYNMESMVII